MKFVPKNCEQEVENKNEQRKRTRDNKLAGKKYLNSMSWKRMKSEGRKNVNKPIINKRCTNGQIRIKIKWYVKSNRKWNINKVE